MSYDVVVIGAGPGGYVSAIRSAQLGLRTALIEKDFVGGTCLNRGCIPTKSIVAVAERFLEMEDLDEFGIYGVDPKTARIDMSRIIERKDSIVAGLRAGIHRLLKSNNIDYVNSVASFVSPTELKLMDPSGRESRITGRGIIIATGSTWRELPGLAADGSFIVNSDHMLELKELPKKLVIIGGGAIGSEFASIMSAFGTDVTVVEMMDQILPLEDAAIARMLTLSLKKRGVKVMTKTRVESIKGGKVMLTTGESIDADMVLVSIGRRPYTDGLNLEAAGIETRQGFILTDETMRTSVPNIYAIGDVCVPRSGSIKPALAHVASKEGLVAAANMVSKDEKIDYSVIPRPVFTIPEIVGVGLTEKELNVAHKKYHTGRFSYAALSKAVCDGAAEGLLQVYSDDGGRILGVHCIGRRASDICAEAALAMKKGLAVKDLVGTIHAHPTYSEIMVEAMEDTEGMAIHKAVSRK